jgi:acetyl esterase/lipase
MEQAERSARSSALQRIFAHLSKAPEGEPSLEYIRQQTEDYAMGEAGEGLARCREVVVQIGGRSGTWFIPPHASEARRHVHLHGGGWIAGSVSSHRALAAEIAFAARMPVLLASYRLAPEHPYPAALDDVTEAFDHAQNFGADGFLEPGRVSLSGDSAGGNLAAALTLRLALSGRKVPEALLLMSPFLAITIDPSAFASQLQDPVVAPQAMAMVGAMYAPGTEVSDVLIEPLRAPDELLARFPPTLVQVSASETLRDQAWAFANRLWSVRAHARLSFWPDVPHVWQVFMNSLPDAQQAIAEAAVFLKSV